MFTRPTAVSAFSTDPAHLIGFWCSNHLSSRIPALTNVRYIYCTVHTRNQLFTRSSVVQHHWSHAYRPVLSNLASHQIETNPFFIYFDVYIKEIWRVCSCRISKIPIFFFSPLRETRFSELVRLDAGPPIMSLLAGWISPGHIGLFNI